MDHIKIFSAKIPSDNVSEVNELAINHPEFKKILASSNGRVVNISTSANSEYYFLTVLYTTPSN